MVVDVLHADELGSARALHDRYQLAVVIDVIRAFTAAPWVLRQGASRLFLAPNPDAALNAKATRFPEALLMKDGAPDPRFELPNAPGLISTLDLSGHTIIQTTGNGTRGAHLVRSVPRVACASFATATAVSRLVARYDRVLLVPTEGDEDYALADFIRAYTEGAAIDLAALLDRVSASAAGIECAQRGTDPAFPGVHAKDLRLCTSADSFHHALVVQPTESLLAVATA